MKEKYFMEHEELMSQEDTLNRELKIRNRKINVSMTGKKIKRIITKVLCTLLFSFGSVSINFSRLN